MLPFFFVFELVKRGNFQDYNNYFSALRSFISAVKKHSQLFIYRLCCCLFFSWFVYKCSTLILFPWLVTLSLPVVCFCFKAPRGKLPNILCIANVLAHNPAAGRQVNCGLFKLLNLSLEALQRDALKCVWFMFWKKAAKEIRIDFIV